MPLEAVIAAAMLACETVKREGTRPAPSAREWAEANAVIVTPGLGVERFRPHPYQLALLEDTSPYRIVLKARQTGLSTVIALEALYHALHSPHDRTLFVSRNQELAGLLIQYVQVAIAGLSPPITLVSESQSKLVFSNGSEIVSLPANASTGRGYPASRVYLDEAAYLSYAELIFQGILPTLTAGGQLTLLSTPHGKVNLFARIWAGQEGGAWSRHTVHYSACPKYDEAWAERTRAVMTEQAFAEEFGCSFEESGTSVVWDRSWATERYDVHDEAMARSVVARILSYDTASKDKATNAFSVGVVGELLDTWRLRIRYVWRERLLMPALVARMEADAARWDEDGKLTDSVVEDRSSGIGAYQTLMASGSDRLRSVLRAFNPTSSKTERFSNAGIWLANASVLLPQPCEETAWLSTFEAEVFGESEFLDQRDAVAQLILWKEPFLAEGLRARQGQAA